MTALLVLYGALVMAFGVAAWASATIAVLLFGGLAGLSGPALAADLPTPWAGLTERVCIGAYLFWFAVLAITLLRRGPMTSTSNAS